MTYQSLASAIAKIVTGSMLLTGAISTASASSTYYNPGNAYSSNINTDQHGADGWRDNSTVYAGWTGLSPAPFGFSNDKLHWAAEITAGGDTLTVSSQDAHDRYGIWADLDTAKGAWSDGRKGWEHNTDIGLFKSAVATDVTITTTALQPVGTTETWSNFGISVYTGMAEGFWSAHGTWNCPNCVLADGTRYAPTYDSDNPLNPFEYGGYGSSYLTHDATVDSVNGITFHADAGVVYTILLGGASGTSYMRPWAGYSLNIATAPVPLPSAIWMFGSALFGLAAAMSKRRLA